MLDDIVADPLFRSIAPVVAGLGFTLITRYVGDPANFDRHDWSLIMPTMGASITAMPALIALHAQDGDSSSDVTLGAYLLVVLLLLGFFLAVLDQRALRQARDSGGAVMVAVGIVLPNLFGAACLAAVFAYAP